MKLPFTHFEFLDVFGRYNQAVWPAVLILWLSAVALLILIARPRKGSGPWIAALLALQWLWSGLVYHLVFFRRINPAASAFGLLFVVQGTLLLWRGVLRGQLKFHTPSTLWTRLGFALITYALVYPVLGLAFGLHYPRLPSFGVPCPTALLAAGTVLYLPRSEARIVAPIPILWAVIGGSAAIFLGIKPDFVLLLAGGALLVYLLGSNSRDTVPSNTRLELTR